MTEPSVGDNKPPPGLWLDSSGEERRGRAGEQEEEERSSRRSRSRRRTRVPPQQTADIPGNAALGRMNSNHEEDEFVAVRVQDPRIQNEGSWNSYVDFKIFLHTNSKAFTAKTSCVRRRYSEFEWLRKKMQKNAGLVPVPDLPGKSFFSFSNEDFLERRRKGLQIFLEKVVHTTVCLSDSQLHLFLQTQLPIGHIQDCVQGHTPYSVTDAILTYASSNRGLAQAQEDDAVKDSSLTVSYESMESPALHPPCPQTNEAFSPELLSCGDPDPLDGLLQPADQDSAASQLKSSVRISQRRNQLEAVLVEDRGSSTASFYLGDAAAPSPEGGGGDGGVRLSVEDSVFEPESDGSAGLDSTQEAKADRFDGSIEILAFRDDAAEEQLAGNDHGAVDDGTVGDVCLVLEDPEATPQLDETCDRQTLEGLMASGEERRSPPSSDGSIVQVSDEEEEEEEEDDLSVSAANGLLKVSPDGLRHWSEVEASGVPEPPLNGYTGQQDEDGGGGESPDVNSAAGDGDVTENSDISILESSGADGRRRLEQDAPGLHPQQAEER